MVECTGLEIRCGVMRHRGFESHPLRQYKVSTSLKKSLKPALRIALAGFLTPKLYQAFSAKLIFLLSHLLLQGSLFEKCDNTGAKGGNKSGTD